MHPDLGGGFGPGYKVAFGYDFIGDAGGAIDATGTIFNFFPDKDPRDQCLGGFFSHEHHSMILLTVNSRIVGCNHIPGSDCRKHHCA